MITTIILTLLLAGVAESKPAPSPGDRVRFSRAGEALTVGRVMEVHPDWILVRPDRGDPVPLGLAETRLEVWKGRRTHARTGAIVGFVPGAAFGMYGAAVFSCWDSPDCSRVGPIAAGGLLVGAATAGLGAVIGSAIKTDRWVTVRRRPLAVSVTPTVAPRGAGLAVTVSFR